MSVALLPIAKPQLGCAAESVAGDGRRQPEAAQVVRSAAGTGAARRIGRRMALAQPAGPELGDLPACDAAAAAQGSADP